MMKDHIHLYPTLLCFVPTLKRATPCSMSMSSFDVINIHHSVSLSFLVKFVPTIANIFLVDLACFYIVASKKMLVKVFLLSMAQGMSFAFVRDCIFLLGVSLR